MISSECDTLILDATLHAHYPIAFCQMLCVLSEELVD